MAKRGRKPKTPALKTRITGIEKQMRSCKNCDGRPQVEFDPATDRLEAVCTGCGAKVRYYGYMCDMSVADTWNRVFGKEEEEGDEGDFYR